MAQAGTIEFECEFACTCMSSIGWLSPSGLEQIKECNFRTSGLELEG